MAQIGSLAQNKILIAGANSNTTAAYFQATNVAATTTGNVIPAGAFIVPATTGVVIQANNGFSFVNVGANGAGGFIISDGINVQLAAFGVANVSAVTLIGVDSGNAITNTFTT